MEARDNAGDKIKDQKSVKNIKKHNSSNSYTHQDSNKTQPSSNLEISQATDEEEDEFLGPFKNPDLSTTKLSLLFQKLNI